LNSFRDKYKGIEKLVREIIRKNPSYGYRRILKALRKEGKIINHKTLKKLLKISKIKLIRKIRHRRKSGVEVILEELGEHVNLVKKLDVIELFQVVFGDITQIVYGNGKGVTWLMVYLEAVSKKVLGYRVGDATTRNVLVAYRIARNFLKRRGVKLNKVYFHQDQGSQFTSYNYIGELIRDGVNISFSRKGHFEDNAEMESFYGRFKEEVRDELYEVKIFDEVKKVVKEKILYYNKDRIHSSLGDFSPDEFIKIHQNKRVKNHS